MPKVSFHPTLLVVTPSGMPHRQLIEKVIAAHDLSILDKQTFFPSDKVIEGFFARRDGQFIDKWRRELPGKKCAFYVIGGENAIKKAIAMSGLSTTPSECRPGTIRALIPDIERSMENGGVWLHTPVFVSTSREKMRTDLESFGVEKYLESKYWKKDTNGTH